MRVKINLVTTTDMIDFINICNSTGLDVRLEDNDGNRVSAKSFLCVSAASVDWNDLFCVCEQDIYGKISKWVV